MTKPNLTATEYKAIMDQKQYDYDLGCYKISGECFTDIDVREDAVLCFTSGYELHSFIVNNYDLI